MPLGFQIQVNEDAPIRAGDDALDVLTAVMTYVASRHETELHVAGLFAGKEHVEWLQRELRVGDRIILTVTDSSDCDAPARRTREDPALAKQLEREYYEHLKARFEPGAR